VDPLTYYTQQSLITDPAAYVGLFADLPRDIAGLCRIVRGLLIHYFADEHVFTYSIPKDRLAEVDTRDVPKMLARIYELDDRPLREARPPENRLVGCCRDFATLFCAMARHQGIPSRVRIGFATYFLPDFHEDHAVAEYWDADEKRWRLVDPQLSDLHRQAYRLRLGALDVPRNQFIVAGQAWQRCRAGELAPEKFGLSSVPDLKGWWFIQNRLIHDLAAQNKQELLLWDTWGLMEKEPTHEDPAFLDTVAMLTQADNEASAEMRAIYEHAVGLKVPPVVRSYSPVSTPREIRLTG
jgi:Transglutaminase-like superfamily